MMISGKQVLIDAADEHLLCHFKWRVNQEGYIEGWMAGYDSSKQCSYRLHRLIMRPGPGLVVDHINGDKLDNRRINLRICTPHQNTQNSPGFSRSGFKGVTVRPRYPNRFRVKFRGKHYGYFDTPEEAHAKYCEAAQAVFGEYFNPNHRRL